ncbi:MAG: phosphopantetheine-binding protein, partial [Ruminiclostridium sp.]
SERVIVNGWLNTGDLGFLREGRVVITGRAKDIIFLNGQNLYPHDIERVAEEINGIDLGSIAACGVENKKDKKDDIILFVLFKKNLEQFLDLSKEIKSHIFSKMGLEVNGIVPIKKMPKTTSGKIQRYKLGQMYLNGEFESVIERLNDISKEIDEDKKHHQESYNLENGNKEPNNQIEAVLHRIVKNILGIDHVGINDNFFDLGGNSLLLTKIHAEIDNVYKGKVAMTDLFTYTSISKLARFIESADSQSQNGIVLSKIEFPQEYFNDRHIANDAAVFKFKLSEIIFNKIKVVCKTSDIDIEDVLLSFYLFLLFKVSNKQTVTIQLPINENMLASELKIYFNDHLDFTELIKMVSEKRSTTSELVKYDVRDAMKANIGKKKGFVIPAFYNTQNVAVLDNLFSIYDFILGVLISENDMNFTFEFDSKRLRKEKMKDLVNGFIKLSEIILSRLIENTEGVLI